jgi:hypothetical protein
MFPPECTLTIGAGSVVTPISTVPVDAFEAGVNGKKAMNIVERSIVSNITVLVFFIYSLHLRT